MKIIRKVQEMIDFSETNHQQDKLIGFVPTMGFLHQGHLSLMKLIRDQVDVLIISIYVNPKQFGPQEDFKKYPRDEQRDINLVKPLVDVVFIPESDDIYPPRYDTFVQVEELSKPLCGKSRPGHFGGVTTVVARLFGIVKPDIAVFGQKDYQQSLIIKRMVEDLNLGVKIQVGPIIREPDGLALSSRNIYLDEQQRKRAQEINQGLALGEKLMKQGETDIDQIISAMTELISGHDLNIEYLEILDSSNLQEVSSMTEQVIIAAAVLVDNIRLIDNRLVDVDRKLEE
ncbi:MAG: pantoate--beta-alanine ligase [Desulfuromonas sp. SDB]|nr:MAG: pantoate--beta-alanine ligase [Desulfuromonas sp. SDB]